MHAVPERAAVPASRPKREVAGREATRHRTFSACSRVGVRREL
jgi:hypothetical protein